MYGCSDPLLIMGIIFLLIVAALGYAIIKTLINLIEWCIKSAMEKKLRDREKLELLKRRNRKLSR